MSHIANFSLPVDENANPINAAYQDMATRYAYDASSNIEYLGKAEAGAATSAAVWQIRKFEYTGSDLTSLGFADGNINFDNVWDNRATYSYS